MEKGDLITYRGVEYIVTSLKNGVHAVLASTDDEAGTSGSSRYLGSIAEVEAELVEQAETATSSRTASRTVSTGHSVTADLDTMTLTIGGQVETMDSIPDSELEAAAALIECAVDWVSGPLDETSYGLIER